MNSSKMYLARLLFLLLPETRCFPLKRLLIRWCGATVGNNVRITSSARFILGGSLEIGDDVWIGEQVLIVGGDADVRIGSRVDIGPRVTIVTGSHELWESPDRAAGKGSSMPIVIEDGVWLGAGATILGGVSVGRSSVIAAGAVVIRDTEPYTINAGNPAVMKRRVTDQKSS